MPEKIRSLFSSSITRFLMVGMVNTLIGSLIMFGAYNLLHLSYWASSAMNYTLVSILSFFLNKHFTFRDKERSIAQALRFALHIAVCYLIAYGLAKPLAASLLSGYSETVRENVAMLVGAGLFTVINYCGQRFFTFRKRKKGNNA